MVGFLSIHAVPVAVQRSSDRQESMRENAARVAEQWYRVQSSGVGVFRVPEPIIFDTPFLEEPVFTFGASLVRKPADFLDLLGSAGVWQWRRDVKGMYVGAYYYLSVTRGETLIGQAGLTPPPARAVIMSHNLVFKGMSFKDLGSKVDTQANVLVPRKVGFGV